MCPRRSTLVVAAVLLSTALGFSTAGAQNLDSGVNRFVASIDVTGPIGPASVKYVRDSLATAGRRHAEAVILRLNTPGGLATSMREIISAILDSPVPVIGFVAPAGAHAASAGTYILYATHVAAMAPGTNVGAATPVQIGGSPTDIFPGTDKDRDKSQGDKSQGGDRAASPDAMTAKVTNDALALIRSLAELRHRNADWAEKAVREAATLSAQGALDKGVIEVIARTPEDLLVRVDGRDVEVAGRHRGLATAGLAIEPLEQGWLIRLLGILSDPNIAFVLMIVGLFGLIFEFSNPGVIAPGVIGAISLFLGLYALNMLPVDYTGLGLMVLGLGFLVAEAFTPTVVLGAGGLLAFVLGAMMLVDTDAPEFQLSWIVIASVAAVCLAFFTLVLGSVWRTRHQPLRAGAPAMLGQVAEVLDWSGEEGHVLAAGERWHARAAKVLARGERVEVTGIDGLTLLVRSGSAMAAGHGGRT